MQIAVILHDVASHLFGSSDILSDASFNSFYYLHADLTNLTEIQFMLHSIEPMDLTKFALLRSQIVPR